MLLEPVARLINSQLLWLVFYPLVCAHFMMTFAQKAKKKKKNGLCVENVKTEFVLTSLFAMGVLSSPGRCCSKARTTQLAVMVARIMYSNGVKAAKLRKSAFVKTQGHKWHKEKELMICSKHGGISKARERSL